MQKNNSKIAMLLTGILTQVFISCTKDYTVGILPDCKVITVSDTSSSRLFLLTYNSSGELEVVYNTLGSKGGYKFVYSETHVMLMDTDATGPAQLLYTYLIGSNGFASLKYGSDTSHADTTFYSYNADGYLVSLRRHKYNSVTPQYNLWYEVESSIINGNITSYKNYSFDAIGNKIIHYSLQVEYSENEANRFSGIYFLYSYATGPQTLDTKTGRLDFFSYAGFLGKSNKNLIKKLKLEGSDYFEYAYDFDYLGLNSNFHQIALPNSLLITKSNLYTFTYSTCKN